MQMAMISHHENWKQSRMLLSSILLIIVSLLFMTGCSEKKQKAASFEDEPTGDVSFEEDYTMEESVPESEEIISIPFREQAGVKVVDVKINDVIGVEMIIDTGCSGALISLSEARYLAEKGTLTANDIIGSTQSMVADGRIVENMVVRLRKITIGGKLEATDVEATVSSNMSAPLLLGNEVLGRVSSISIDNENKNILFKLK